MRRVIVRDTLRQRADYICSLLEQFHRTGVPIVELNFASIPATVTLTNLEDLGRKQKLEVLSQITQEKKDTLIVRFVTRLGIEKVSTYGEYHLPVLHSFKVRHGGGE